MTISIGFVAAHLKIREKTFHSFFKGHVVSGKFVTLKIILEVGWREAMPVHHRRYSPWSGEYFSGASM